MPCGQSGRVYLWGAGFSGELVTPMWKIAFKTQGLVGAALILSVGVAFAQEVGELGQGAGPLQGTGSDPLQSGGPLQGTGPFHNMGSILGAAPLQGAAGNMMTATGPILGPSQIQNALPPLMMLASLPTSLLTLMPLAPLPLPTDASSPSSSPAPDAPRTSGGASNTLTVVPSGSSGDSPTSFTAPTPTPVVAPQNVCNTASCT